MRQNVYKRIGQLSACSTHQLTHHHGHSPYRLLYSTHARGLDLLELDHKWRQKWQNNQKTKISFVQRDQIVPDGRIVSKKKYILPMFPYPSGDLHLGHLRVYTISDVLARFYRMNGFEVIHPIGWDAFGLPAENAAIDRGIDPKTWTIQNIEKMRSQLKNMNGHWDWDREFATCDPGFYKHTQKLFTLLHRKGLAYQAESLVNFDPVDQTVLANEQVDINGHSWRSGAKVEKRLLKQWFLKISEYQQELLDDLKILESSKSWPEKVLLMQKNWLGKSSGAQIKFSLLAENIELNSNIEVFTTRPDTLFGVQYLALAPKHLMVQRLAKTDSELQSFLDQVLSLPQDSKLGYELPMIRAINPLAYDKSMPEACKASIPIFVAPYVLGEYGTGAVMGVPGHDVRDNKFWQHNRPNNPIRYVVTKVPNQPVMHKSDIPFTDYGYLTSECGPYLNMSSTQAAKLITATLQSSGFGSLVEKWRIRDWLISRQRYWGTPIPIIHCNQCGPVVVPDDQLPVELPSIKAHWGSGKLGNPLETAHDWINTMCPSCGGPARRETDTMDTFVDSSWYFLRFLDVENPTQLLSLELAKANLPVDIYVGGVEHAILHLLYARFIFKFISDTHLKSLASDICKEPFRVLLAQGMVHGKTYSDPSTGRFLKPSEVDLQNPIKPVILASGQTPNISFEKMSKSKYNGVDPNICREKYGADTLRAHILFQAPVTETLEWHEEKITGIVRWLRRLYDYISCEHETWNSCPNKQYECAKDYFLSTIQRINIDNVQANVLQNIDPTKNTVDRIIRDNDEKIKQLWRAVQGTISSVTDSYDKTYSLNTVISDLMVLTNAIIDFSRSHKDRDKLNIKLIKINHSFIHWSLQELIKMMAPITPAFAEECWELLASKSSKSSGYTSDIGGSVFNHRFPTLDNTYELISPRTQSCVVQINGRLRLVLEIPILPENLKGPDAEEWITNQILSTEEGRHKLTGKKASTNIVKNSDEEKLRHNDKDIRAARKIIVVKRGRVVNYVI